MYALKNRVQLIGNLGNKPDVKITPKGKKHASFQLATDEDYRDADGEKVAGVQWHRVVAWGKVAEVVEKHLDKGREVAIGGRLINRSYNDKGGNKRYITEVLALEVLLLGGKAK